MKFHYNLYVFSQIKKYLNQILKQNCLKVFTSFEKTELSQLPCVCTEIKLKSTTIQWIQLLSNKFINGIFGVWLTWLDCNIIQLKNETSDAGPACIIMNQEIGIYFTKNNIQEQNSISDFLLLTNIYTSTI